MIYHPHMPGDEFERFVEQGKRRALVCMALWASVLTLSAGYFAARFVAWWALGFPVAGR